jgi:hypothetical protein
MEMTDTQLIQSVLKMQEELVSALADVSRLTEDMAKMQNTHAAWTPIASSDEERAKVMKFMFNLQNSGITNMFSADEYLQKRFGFTKSRAQDYLFDYIDNYSELQKTYGVDKVEVASKSEVVEATPLKKRKGPKPYAEMTPEELAEAKARKQKKAEEIQILPDSVDTLVPTSSTEGRIVAKKTILKLKKNPGPEGQEVKPKGVLIWNSFMKTVKAEMEAAAGQELSYDDIRKKAQEMKEADPESYKLFSDNWTA